ncbi:MAG: MATE family efflux transporter, partial [Flavobacteriales bacterium]|nr:MATE family efflux transporter [Flavobacteriales bacterium]
MKKLLQLVRESLADTERDYTRMGVRRAIVLLSIPMVLELSMESLFALVDVFFVGRISTAAVAAVGLTESVLIVVYSIAWGLSMGVTAVVSRRTGEKDKEGAAISAMQGLWVALAVSLALGIPLFVF